MKIEKHYRLHGAPHIKLGNVEIWIFGYQFPDATDSDDANWLNVSVICKSEGSVVKTDGNIMQTYDIEGFVSEIEKMYQSLTGSATLCPLEPNIRIELKMEKHGHISVTVEITPEHMSENHKYKFEIDQSYLPGFIKDCGVALRKYPTRVKLGRSRKIRSSPFRFGALRCGRQSGRGFGGAEFRTARGPRA